MRITSAGNVFFGATSAVSFETFGVAHQWSRFYTTSATDYALIDVGNATTRVRIGVDNSTGGSLATGTSAYASYIGSSGAYPLQLGSYGEVAITVNSSNNVGIGTTSPTQKLDVRGIITSYTAVDNFSRMDNGSFQATGNHGGTFMLDLDNNGSADLVNIKKSGTSRFYIKNAGNVGIGTTSPASKLQINVGTNQNVAINSTGGIARISAYDDAVANSVPLIINGSDLRLHNNSAEAVRITGGNVGINQTAPTYTLEVAGDIRTTTLRVDNPGSGPGPTPGTPANGVGINNSTYLGEPNAWLTININGTDYVIPAYTP
jgi:hypothetical protein